ncbi:MAG: amidohydrolase family protein, partial [Elusimicrobiales bacterium]|nr:amidohydrolase family protein [Elusimicrobiales bacterium]
DAMTVNMMEEIRAALWLCHLKNSNPSVGFPEVTKTLENNAKIASKYFEKIGEIKEGNFADIIIVDYIPTTPLKEDNFMGHLIFGISQSNIDTTIVNGNILMEKEKLNFIDEKEVARKSQETAKKIWNRF